jgi:hypothetical protein
MGLNPMILRQVSLGASGLARSRIKPRLAAATAKRFSRVPGMFGSLEVKVLYPT